VAVIGSTGQRRHIVDVSEPANAQGVRPGMTLAEARALCPGMACLEHDPAGDYRGLEALGRWMTCFTPVVAVGWSDDVDSTPRMPARRKPPRTGKSSNAAAVPDESGAPVRPVLFLDITGSERLFGSAAQLAGRVTRAIERFNIPARIAIAPTVGAAWALASAGSKSALIVDADGLRDALAPLPVMSLRLQEEIVAALHHLGLRTIGQLLALPREQLPARFGPTLLTRLDQAIGAKPESLVPLSYEVPVAARIELDGPASSLEAIWAIFQMLLRQIVQDLVRRGRGARQLDLICKFDSASARPDVIKVIHLSRPSRDFNALFNLIRCATEQLNGGREGFVSFQIKAPVHERITEEQASFAEDHVHQNEVQFDRLIERLRVRLGQSAVVRPALVESYLPERAWKPAAESGSSTTTLTTPAVSSSTAAVELLTKRPRPLHLLATPAEVLVVSEPSDISVGSPRQFTWNGRVYRVAVVAGPERIAGEWWRGHCRTRDYYEVEDAKGLRFWLFRVIRRRMVPSHDGSNCPQTRVRWFLHGLFE
jgi:protein ImuB